MIEGQVSASDVDSDDDSTGLTYSLVGAAPDGLTFNADGSYSCDPGDAAYQDLAAGEVMEVNFGWRDRPRSLISSA